MFNQKSDDKKWTIFNHLKHVILLNSIEFKTLGTEQLAWTNTEASDDADHTTDTDVAHE